MIASRTQHGNSPFIRSVFVTPGNVEVKIVFKVARRLLLVIMFPSCCSSAEEAEVSAELMEETSGIVLMPDQERPKKKEHGETCRLMPRTDSKPTRAWERSL
jgi:hypothetical protein